MNPFRAIAAWLRRRRAARVAEIEAALATLTRAGIIAPNPAAGRCEDRMSDVSPDLTNLAPAVTE